MNKPETQNKPETTIQNEIRCALSKYGIVVRMNTGNFKTIDNRNIRVGIKGMPDLLFIGPEGFTAWIEVKTVKGKPSKEQIRFIEKLKSMNHTAGICRSVKDAEELIKYGKV